jgi:radical SAM superfamily enzyme YgiQ (UPF0313 family)
MRKGWNVKWQDFETSIGVMRDAGIMIYGSFVHGYDHDTPLSFDETVEFAIRHRFVLANFNPLTPTPRAPLYDRLAREGRLIYDHWWLDPRFRYGQATFHPRGMTAQQLTEGCWRARRAFSSATATARRFLAPQTTLATPGNAVEFLIANFINRREIRRKQGVPLGGPEPLVLPETLPPVPAATDTAGAGADASRDELIAAETAT